MYLLWGYSALKRLKMDNCVYLVKLGFEGMTEGVNEGRNRGKCQTVDGEYPVFIDFLDFRGI